MSERSVFIEKQYLGREWIPITIRLVLAMFCFAAYFFTDERERNGDLLAVVGFVIITISIILGFLGRIIGDTRTASRRVCSTCGYGLMPKDSFTFIALTVSKMPINSGIVAIPCEVILHDPSAPITIKIFLSVSSSIVFFMLVSQRI